MNYFRTCPKCGANLDPEEHCECELEERRARKEGERIKKRMRTNERTGQCYFPLAGECREP